MRYLSTTTILIALALPTYAAVPSRKFEPPKVSKQQEQAYNQTYKTDKAQEQRLKAATAISRTHG